MNTWGAIRCASLIRLDGGHGSHRCSSGFTIVSIPCLDRQEHRKASVAGCVLVKELDPKIYDVTKKECERRSKIRCCEQVCLPKGKPTGTGRGKARQEYECRFGHTTVYDDGVDVYTYGSNPPVRFLVPPSMTVVMRSSDGHGRYRLSSGCKLKPRLNPFLPGKWINDWGESSSTWCTLATKNQR